MMLMNLLLSSVAVASSYQAGENRNPLSSILTTYTPPSCESLLNLPDGEFGRPPDDFNFGLVTKRPELTVENILASYERGIFPWGPSGASRAEWYSPPWRGVLKLSQVHIGRSDRKFLRAHLDSGEYEVTFDKAFDQVIARCASQARWKENSQGEKVPAQAWLTDLFVQRYTELHEQGYAHSVEVWRNGELVAGLYGTFVKGMFSGESMFHDPEKGTDATKLAFYALIERLRATGHTMIDTQVAVGLAEKWGARQIPRGEYQRLLRLAQEQDLPY